MTCIVQKDNEATGTGIPVGKVKFLLCLGFQLVFLGFPMLPNAKELNYTVDPTILSVERQLSKKIAIFCSCIKEANTREKLLHRRPVCF